MRLDDGCTDTTIFRGNGFWEITFRNAGIPASDPLGTERFRGGTLNQALTRAFVATAERRAGVRR